VIPRVDNRRLRTTASDDEAEKPDEQGEANQDGENEYIDLEQIKKLDED